MIGVEDVMGDLLDRGRHRPDALATWYGIRTGSGVFDLDYGDPDSVFVVTVQGVPRRRPHLPHPVPVGTVDGLQMALGEVLVDSQVRVGLEVSPSARRDQVEAHHRAAFDQWASLGASERRAQDPPSGPGSPLMDVEIMVTDDGGTSYSFLHGRSGGTDTPWQAQRCFQPAPPTHATRLRLWMRAGEGPAVEVELPLSPSSEPTDA